MAAVITLHVSNIQRLNEADKYKNILQLLSVHFTEVMLSTKTCTDSMTRSRHQRYHYISKENFNV